MELLLYLSNPIFAVGVFFTILTAIAFSLRLYTKRLNKSGLGLDDLLLFMAVFCFDVENIIQLYCLNLARKIEDPSDPLYATFFQVCWSILYKDQADNSQWIWISTTFAVPTLTFIKLSVLVFYRRIFTTSRWFRISSFSLLIIVAVYGISGTMGEIFECMPPRPNWGQQSDSTSRCMPADVYGIWLLTYVILDTLLDAVILVLPLVIISQLHLPLWKRRSLIGVFMLGGFTIATNIIRLAFMSSNAGDSDRIGMINELWIAIHTGSGIVCACLPLYGPLVTRFTSLASSLRQSYNSRKSAAAGRPANVDVWERPGRKGRSSYIRMDNEADASRGTGHAMQDLDPESPPKYCIRVDTTVSVV